jgi:hypothetical protein
VWSISTISYRYLSWVNDHLPYRCDQLYLIITDVAFLDLEDNYDEHDLKTAIFLGLTHFLQRIGTDFNFIARQKCMTLGSKGALSVPGLISKELNRMCAIVLMWGVHGD